MGRGRPWAVLLLYVLLPAMMLDAAAGADVNVGVVLDMGTLVGKMCWASIVAAAEDFYAAHPNYTTKLALHPRDARADVVGAGSAGENLKSSLSKAVVIVWVFVVLILSSSYTASLSSRLTVEQLQPSVADMDQLMRSGDRVGYSHGSFIYGLLRRSFSKSRLVPLTGADEYAAALSNGTVAAVFHELPYIKLFLKKYCTRYTVIGPTTRTSGFGFVFSKGSPLLPDVSAAVLRVTQGPDMEDIERKWMENDSTCKAQDDRTLPSATRLTFYSLRGLFLITAVTSISALLIALVFIRPRANDDNHAPAPADTTRKRLSARHLEARSNTSSDILMSSVKMSLLRYESGTSKRCPSPEYTTKRPFPAGAAAPRASESGTKAASILFLPAAVALCHFLTICASLLELINTGDGGADGGSNSARQDVPLSPISNPPSSSHRSPPPSLDLISPSSPLLSDDALAKQ